LCSRAFLSLLLVCRTCKLSLGKLGSVSSAQLICRPKGVALKSLVEDRVSVDRGEGRGALLVTLVIL
jgi:hypothetical protein